MPSRHIKGMFWCSRISKNVRNSHRRLPPPHAPQSLWFKKPLRRLIFMGAPLLFACYLFRNHKSFFLLASPICCSFGEMLSEENVSLCAVEEGRKKAKLTLFCAGGKPSRKSFSLSVKRRKNEGNLYSEIVFMCAIIISNGNVCVPYTSAWNRLHLSDLFSLLPSSSLGAEIKEKLGNIGFLSDDKLHALPHTKWTLHFCAILSRRFEYLLMMTEKSSPVGLSYEGRRLRIIKVSHLNDNLYLFIISHTQRMNDFWALRAGSRKTLSSPCLLTKRFDGERIFI